MSLYYKSKIIATRISSFPGEILVKKGDNVSPETIVLRTNYRLGRLCILRAANIFDISPKDIGKYTIKKEGDIVKWTERIAGRTTFEGSKYIESPVDGTIEKIDLEWGVIIVREILERPDIPIVLDIKEKVGESTHDIRKAIIKKTGERVEYGETVAGFPLAPYVPVYTKKVVSPCAGTIIDIDYDNGKVSIQKDLQKVDMKAHYWGMVHKIIPQSGVEIEFGGYVLEGAYGTGDIAWGKLTHNAANAKSNILLTEYLSLKDISRVIEHQPAGIIASSIDYEGIALLEQQHITSIIAEGFGKLQMKEESADLLTQSVGRNTVLKAATQVRAGVIRPEIVIPSDREFYKHKKLKGKVRIIWGQYYGKKGVLKEKPQYSEASSGIKTWVCEVLCDDGKVITVPLSNLHTID
jgi:hypothetical protein